MTPLFPCPSCWFIALDEKNSYDICPVCNWEDDPVQNEFPLSDMGANHYSLIKSQENILKKIPRNIKEFNWYIRSSDWELVDKKNIKNWKIITGEDYFNAA